MRRRASNLILDCWAVAAQFALLLVPLLFSDSLVFSLTNQIAIGVAAAMGVYVMLRMNLLSFTVPSFMAVGGYSAALAATHGLTNLIVLMAIALVAPMILAVPVGALVLRLRGVHSVFFTFILNEALQVAIFETPDLTGGANGIAGIPPATLFGLSFATPALQAVVTIVASAAAALVTLVVTYTFRSEFAAIDENETLAASLGVAVWKYRSIGFVASSGVSGLAGFALVQLLSTAHPSSFTSISAINYVAYVVVGGKGTMLGPVLGGALMILLSNLFSSQGVYSAALFGLLLIGAVMIAPAGFVGAIRNQTRRLSVRRSAAAGSRA